MRLGLKGVGLKQLEPVTHKTKRNPVAVEQPLATLLRVKQGAGEDSDPFAQD